MMSISPLRQRFIDDMELAGLVPGKHRRVSIDENQLNGKTSASAKDRLSISVDKSRWNAARRMPLGHAPRFLLRARRRKFGKKERTTRKLPARQPNRDKADYVQQDFSHWRGGDTNSKSNILHAAQWEKSYLFIL